MTSKQTKADLLEALQAANQRIAELERNSFEKALYEKE